MFDNTDLIHLDEQLIILFIQIPLNSHSSNVQTQKEQLIYTSSQTFLHIDQNVGIAGRNDGCSFSCKPPNCVLIQKIDAAKTMRSPGFTCSKSSLVLTMTMNQFQPHRVLMHGLHLATFINTASLQTAAAKWHCSYSVHTVQGTKKYLLGTLMGSRNEAKSIRRKQLSACIVFCLIVFIVSLYCKCILQPTSLRLSPSLWKRGKQHTASILQLTYPRLPL